MLYEGIWRESFHPMFVAFLPVLFCPMLFVVKRGREAPKLREQKFVCFKVAKKTTPTSEPRYERCSLHPLEKDGENFSMVYIRCSLGMLIWRTLTSESETVQILYHMHYLREVLSHQVGVCHGHILSRREKRPGVEGGWWYIVFIVVE